MNKYNARRVKVDNILFDSIRESARYGELKILQRAGEISNLELQPAYKLGTDEAPVLIKSKGYPNGRRVTYRADFRYIDKAGNTIVEDSKGVDTPTSRLKRALVESQYSIIINLV